MAPSKLSASKTSTRKSSTKSSPKVQTAQVLRRSARNKRDTTGRRGSSPEELIQAARLLQGVSSKSDAQNATSSVPSGQDLKVNKAKAPKPQFGALQDFIVPRQPRVIKPNASAKTSSAGVQPQRKNFTVIPPANEDRPRRQSILTPAREKCVRNLLVADIVSEAVSKAKDAAKLKRGSDASNSHHATVRPLKRRMINKVYVSDFAYKLPDNPTVYLLSELDRHPTYLSIGQISEILQIIQGRIFGDGVNQGFAERHFNFSLSQAQVNAWPLHELRTNYLPLYMTTRYIADGSQYSWRNFFTHRQTRQHLAAAILGEWFTQRIFKHTAFGFPQQLVDILEDKDREYLHYDAIVRSKARAKLMKEWFDNWQTQAAIMDGTTIAADGLAEELLTVLRPLLPPPLFNPLDAATPTPSQPQRKNSIQLHKATIKNDLRTTIKRDLINLIRDCAALHLSIRLSGQNGTIIRMTPHVPKGSQFHPTAPVDCVNQQMCNQTIPADPSDPSELCIKMTCFPRVEALVPNGPDLAELEFLQREYRYDLSLKTQQWPSIPPTDEASTTTTTTAPVTETAVAAGAAPPSPSSSSSSSTSSPKDNDNDTPIQDFTWAEKDSHWPIVPSHLQDNEGQHAGELDPETGKLNTIKRAAYVTLHNALCPAKVYCEWTPPASRGQPKETLEDAVVNARKTHAEHMKLRLEDFRIAAWNGWALYGGVAQWGVVSAAAVVAVARALGLPGYMRVVVERMLGMAGRVVRGVMDGEGAVGGGGVDEMRARVVREVVDAWEGIDLGVGSGSGSMLGVPVELLFVKPLEGVHSLVRALGWSGGGVVLEGADVEMGL